MPVEPIYRVTLQLWIIYDTELLVIITVNLSIDKDIFLHVDARFTMAPNHPQIIKDIKGGKTPDCFDEQNTQMMSLW